MVSYLWLFAFAAVAFLSVFWSAVPSISMRASIQYLTQVICALVAVRVLDARTLTVGMVAGVGIVLIYSLLFGYYEYDPLDGTFSFVGAFASKNQLGFYASLGLIVCVAAVFIFGERRLWIAAAGVVGMLSAYCLHRLSVGDIGADDGRRHCADDGTSGRHVVVAPSIANCWWSAGAWPSSCLRLRASISVRSMPFSASSARIRR